MLLVGGLLLIIVAAIASGWKYELGAPKLNEPSNVTATSVELSWSEVKEAELYLLDVSTRPDFKPTVSDYSKKELTKTNTMVKGLEGGETYYVRVFAKSKSAVSGASNVIQVVTVSR